MMKQLFFSFASLLLIYSCSKPPQPVERIVIGQYQLIEILADPGDGSGTFQTVNSSKTLTFYSDETFECNGNVCSMSEDANQASSGVYSFSDTTISNSNCFDLNLELGVNELILSYPCIEPCRAKYSLIGN